MLFGFALKNSLRFKLLLSLVFVVLLIGFFSIFIGIKIINNNVIGQAYDSVQSNLTTAQFIYNERINIIRIYIEHIASLPYVKDALINKNRDLLVKKLQEVREEAGLDIMNIADREGTVIVRAGNADVFGDSVRNDLFVDYVISRGMPVSGTDIITGKDLDHEIGGLAERAYIGRIRTPRAQKRDTAYEDRGLVLKAAYPIFNRGRLIGILYGAEMINRNYEIVDRIKSLVFKDEKYNGYDYGTATVFLDDMRISTNVKSKDGSRAIGTCVSEEVYNKVVRQGNVWLDEAFVVHNWYISAYKPIYNIQKDVIGILYVGILKAKFDQIKWKTVLSFLAVILITLLIAIMLAVYLIQNILRPIKTLVDASRDISAGRYDRKISITSSDELGYLCATFNSMIDDIVERDHRLKEQRQKQTMQLQKMASLGRLASGIAHEINNPLTGVLAFSSELLEDLKDTDYKEDLELIVNETLRCRKIVKGVLDFARETKLEKTQADINTVILDTLSILDHHIAFQNIRIIKRFSEELPSVFIDVNQMKSVFNNLALNAVDAMPEGGDLIITTQYDAREKAMRISFSDTGEGISPENIEKLFDPFFTTKETGKGTGLGLAITFGVIQRHKGTIAVESDPGTGTTFTITIPVG